MLIGLWLILAVVIGYSSILGGALVLGWVCDKGGDKGMLAVGIFLVTLFMFAATSSFTHQKCGSFWSCPNAEMEEK